MKSLKIIALTALVGAASPALGMWGKMFGWGASTTRAAMNRSFSTFRSPSVARYARVGMIGGAGLGTAMFGAGRVFAEDAQPQQEVEEAPFIFQCDGDGWLYYAPKGQFPRMNTSIQLPIDWRTLPPAEVVQQCKKTGILKKKVCDELGRELSAYDQYVQELLAQVTVGDVLKAPTLSDLQSRLNAHRDPVTVGVKACAQGLVKCKLAKGMKELIARVPTKSMVAKDQTTVTINLASDTPIAEAQALLGKFGKAAQTSESAAASAQQ